MTYFDRDTTTDLDVGPDMVQGTQDKQDSTFKLVEDSGEKARPTPPRSPPAAMMAAAMFGIASTLRKGNASEKRPCVGTTKSGRPSRGTVANEKNQRGNCEQQKTQQRYR